MGGVSFYLGLGLQLGIVVSCWFPFKTGGTSLFKRHLRKRGVPTKKKKKRATLLLLGAEPEPVPLPSGRRKITPKRDQVWMMTFLFV